MMATDLVPGMAGQIGSPVALPLDTGKVIQSVNKH